jgi:hypothetical protein
MYIELNATNPAPPAGAQNVHFREDATHLGTSADPRPVSAYVVPMTGDTGSGGASGLVPAPAAGDAAAGKVFGAAGAFELLPLTIGFCVLDGSTGTSDGPLLVIPRAGSISKCTISITASDSSTALSFRIKRNGTDIFSLDPTFAAAVAVPEVSISTALTSTPLAVASGDQFTIDITSGSSSWKFTAQLS